jgi:hypothetical protein
MVQNYEVGGTCRRKLLLLSPVVFLDFTAMLEKIYASRQREPRSGDRPSDAAHT